MKKIITLGAAFLFSFSALSISAPADAKRGFGVSPVRSTPMRKPATQQKTQQQKNTQQQKDADFNNTPPKQTIPNTQAQTAQSPSMANFATGALAGYMLSSALSSNEAQANPLPENAEKPLQQLTEQVQQTPAVPQVPAFKSIDANDPFLIEKTAGYMRYCLNGVQYLISTANTQLPPTLMVDRNNAPAQCVIVQ